MVNSRIISGSNIEHDFPSLTEKHHKETVSYILTIHLDFLIGLYLFEIKVPKRFVNLSFSQRAVKYHCP